MILREYQLDLACDVMASHLTIARKVLLVMPCRSGKTPTLSYIITHEPGNVWVIAHRQELIEQASNTLKRFGVTHGIVKAGHPFQPKQRVQVASIQTLIKRHHLLPPPTMIVVDESHRAVSPSYKKVIETYPLGGVLGVTASPCRTNGEGLGSIFEHMIVGPSERELTKEGYLTPVVYYAPPVVADTASIPVTMGDYARAESEEVMNKPTVTGDAVEHYRRICDGVPMIVFCTSIQHAEDVAKAYQEAGYRAVSVDGSMSDEDRKDRIYGLGEGRYDVVTSCELISEGLDIPGVGAVQLLRPTESLGLHIQQTCRPLNPIYAEGHDLTTASGRVAAIAAGTKPYAYILDHVNNIKHGLPTATRHWTLKGKVKSKKPTEKALRTCGHCFLSHDPTPVCPMCGYEYPKVSKALTRIENVGGELVRIEETKEERAVAMRDARSMVELIAFAKSRGYKNAGHWARKVYGGRSYLGSMPKV